MTNQFEIYKCSVCGNIVEVVHASGGTLVCCGQNMNLLVEKTNEEGNEKHLPVIKRMKSKIKVKIGAKKHPMEENHHIEFVEILVNGKSYKQFLKPNDKPIAEFKLVLKENESLIARCYCNIHGVWKNS